MNKHEQRLSEALDSLTGLEDGLMEDGWAPLAYAIRRIRNVLADFIDTLGALGPDPDPDPEGDEPEGGVY